MHTLDPLTAPVPPLAALRRIAYLLERQRASSYKAEAFRRAAAALGRLGEPEVRRRDAAGTLTDVPGVGRSTGRVVAQALAGQVPDYLAELQAAAVPLATGGEDLFAAVVGDLHMHSDWSDGGAPIEEMVLTAVETGHEWVALTDHSPWLTVANGLSAERLARQLGVVAEVEATWAGQVRVLRGIEVDILEDGALDQTPETLDRLDVVTASVHSQLRMAPGPMTRRMVAAVANPRVNVLGHCTGRLVTGGRGTRPPSTFDAGEVFAACAAHDVAVEINSRPERQDPPDELIGQALAAGCLFSIDSDAHAPGQLEMKAYGAERARRLGVPAERIVTTWPVDRVTAWAGR
ncbi:PHP domain-containing protein [Georgenia sp. TF02-10]|uniref:PHP domain-containing protein n=1 Tax=Georgenia sp. TF02-10 TaxID=2917725 RepID=UPI001FA7FE61|nr:PHP domain-containing protein [Georgenia sp. TF02-10]UNX55632.1 PHP domain-containing protein [Georgenia sp. TF02-10]